MVFRRQRKRTRKASRGFGKRFSKSVSSKPELVILPAMAYGAGRKYLSDVASPITSKVAGFAGDYADELVFGLAGWYVAKKNLLGLKQVGLAMLTVEAASVGNQLASNFGGTSNASKQNVTYYG
jgi:hypothetical protein